MYNIIKYQKINDEEFVKILNKCKEAANTGNGRQKGRGKAIIITLLRECKNENDTLEAINWSATINLFDFQMMVVHGGKERSIKDWESLFFTVSFSNYQFLPAHKWCLFLPYFN
ncbi:hypothetical protein M9H77_08878 [Catharanthus roseus]|uniref:Uncharacterized protein n=1 Tax=Catharanthus roseus TaxID=4058 RepID=A0ACC0BZC9_CATRO|nr:hypothetical protein M9H77_08878 [Catharanthus roseus]